jgi:hypothetical protein
LCCDPGVLTVEFTGLQALGDALRDVDDEVIVVAVPPGTWVVDDEAALDAYEALDGTVVLGATAVARVAPEVAATHPDVSTPYRFVAGDLVAGPAAALRALGARAAQVAAPAGAAADVDRLTAWYLAGDDLELDVAASLFLVLDGTGTDALVLSGAPVAAATGTTPAVVAGPPAAIDALRADAATDRSHDLVRLFSYDALASGGEAPVATVVAPELVTVPFWSREFCATVVRAAEACGAWSADPDDPVPGSEIPLATISPQLLAHVEAHMGELVVPALRDVWPEFAWNGLHDAFVIRYVAGGADELPLHHDVAQISASVRLNDGYAGGALEFPRQRWDNASLPPGTLVAWPSLVTHPHRSRPVRAGVKYGLTLWFALPT